MLTALGVEVPASYAGRDLALRVNEPSAAAVSMHDVPGSRPLWALRTPAWKLKRVGREVLFDLAADPKERRDVAARHPERAAALRKLGEKLLQERRRPKDVTARLSADTQKQLRELGYIE